MNKQTIADYLFLNFKDTMADILQLAARFSKEGKNLEIYPENDKLWKQFWYADKKGIPYVVVYWEGEKQQGIYKIKNMKTGEEESLKL